MENSSKRFQYLFKLYTRNKLSVEQFEEFCALLAKDESEKKLKNELKILWKNTGNEEFKLTDEEWNYKMNLLRNRIESKDYIDETTPVRKIAWFKKYRWAAAVLLILLSTVFYTIVMKSNRNGSGKKEIAFNPNTNDKKPGDNIAVLTLADGTQIILDSAQNGILAKQGNTDVIKQQDGQLLYSSGSKDKLEAAMQMNTLSTPNGGQYALTLPDGSKIWLNAASSIKYPSAFTGLTRKVEITGEAYFEIAKDAKHPFIVAVNNTEVEVLGTHFNINSYADEDAVKTTLLEGSVKVKSADNTGLLTPGQQAKIDIRGKISVVKDVNTELIVAWKEGNFYFEDADIKSIMNQLGRWYNTKIEYKGVVKNHFGGIISRNVTLSKVLNMLQQTGGVKFEIKQDMVIVSPQ